MVEVVRLQNQFSTSTRMQLYKLLFGQVWWAVHEPHEPLHPSLRGSPGQGADSFHVPGPLAHGSMVVPLAWRAPAFPPCSTTKQRRAVGVAEWLGKRSTKDAKAMKVMKEKGAANSISLQKCHAAGDGGELLCNGAEVGNGQVGVPWLD